jgi:hypothetical protein
MASIRRNARAAADRTAGVPNGDFAQLMRALRELVDPYHPEQHYMRGPGPKWRAKNEPPEEREGRTMPALLRTRVRVRT